MGSSDKWKTNLEVAKWKEDIAGHLKGKSLKYHLWSWSWWQVLFWNDQPAHLLHIEQTQHRTPLNSALLAKECAI